MSGLHRDFVVKTTKILSLYELDNSLEQKRH